MKICLTLILISAWMTALSGQDAPSRAFNAGVELDALPYLTGGYFAAIWAGKDPWRMRILTANVHKPDWSTTKGFVNHHVKAYALVVDRFFQPAWKGWWMGGGLVYWESTIQSEARQQTAEFDNFLLNGSMGYNLQLFQRFYLSPWAGLSVRISGHEKTPVDDRQFRLPFLNPEASLKLGWFF